MSKHEDKAQFEHQPQSKTKNTRPLDRVPCLERLIADYTSKDCVARIMPLKTRNGCVVMGFKHQNGYQSCPLAIHTPDGLERIPIRNLRHTGEKIGPYAIDYPKKVRSLGDAIAAAERWVRENVDRLPSLETQLLGQTTC